MSREAKKPHVCAFIAATIVVSIAHFSHGHRKLLRKGYDGARLLSTCTHEYREAKFRVVCYCPHSGHNAGQNRNKFFMDTTDRHCEKVMTSLEFYQDGFISRKAKFRSTQGREISRERFTALIAATILVRIAPNLSMT